MTSHLTVHIPRSWCCPDHSQEALPLLIVCSLILHPIPELAHTADLLSIVVRYWVREWLAWRIYPVSHDLSVEVFLLLYHHWTLAMECDRPPTQKLLFARPYADKARFNHSLLQSALEFPYAPSRTRHSPRKALATTPPRLNSLSLIPTRWTDRVQTAHPAGQSSAGSAPWCPRMWYPRMWIWRQQDCSVGAFSEGRDSRSRLG